MLPNVFPLPKPVHDLWVAQQALAHYYADSGLEFTLDGRLVGDIAEAIALDQFDLIPPPMRTKGVDALTRANHPETVQIKATGKENTGPAFSHGIGTAKYLLFFRIDFDLCQATLFYNGLEAPVRARLLPEKWSGTKRVNLRDLLALQVDLGDANALPLKKPRVTAPLLD